MTFIEQYIKFANQTPFASELTCGIEEGMSMSQVSDTIRYNNNGEFVEGICSGLMYAAQSVIEDY